MDPARSRLYLRLAYAFGFSTAVRPGSAAPLLDGGVDPALWFMLDAEELERRGVTPAQRRRLWERRGDEQAARWVEQSAAAGLRIVTREDPLWPASLNELPRAPLVLWMLGAPGATASDAVAVVGARHPTPYGAHAARAFSEALAIGGLTITSGLAYGIDAEAHESALRCGVPTIAVLGSAIDALYPAEHAGLAARIADSGGLIVSEYPPGYRANPGTFPRRNRIIAGLSRAVLVVEAGRRSGALITADWALEYGLPVWAVPGHYSSPMSAGCHKLIREGAGLADSPGSLLTELGVALPAGASDTASTLLGSALEAEVLETLRRGPTLVDALVTETRAELAKVLVALQRLEAAGHVECRAGGLYHVVGAR